MEKEQVRETSEIHVIELTMHDVATEFVLVRVRPEPLSLALSLVQGVLEKAVSSGGNVGELLSSVVTVYFGFPKPDPRAEARRVALVANLVEEHGPHIAVVHGSATWPTGAFGSSERMHVGPIARGLNEQLAMLMSLGDGEVREAS